MNSGQLMGRGPGSVALPGDWGGAVPRGEVSGVLSWLVLLPLCAAVLLRWLAWRTAKRVAVAVLLGTAAVAAYLLFSRRGLGGVPGPGAVAELVQPLWHVLAVQRLQLTVGLCLDRPAAAMLVGVALLAAGAVRGASRGQAAWLAAACAAAAVALLGDNLVTRLVGWELLSVTGWALGRRPGTPWRGAAVGDAAAADGELGPRRVGTALRVARAGDATLLVATALLFWALGGSWSSSRLDARYQLDFSPPQAAAATAGRAVGAGQVAEQGPTLDLPSLRAQLHAPVGDEPHLGTARATLYNKLWLGGRLLTWLEALFGLAAALKGVAGVLQLLAARGSTVAVRLWLGVAPGLCAGHLLWWLW